MGPSNHFYIGGDPENTLLVVEGFATGASLHEITGLPVVVAFNSGNLPPVAVVMKEKYPDTRLVICADNDQKTDCNPGLAAANKAAKAAGGVVAFPEFDDPELSDFNDLARHSGASAVQTIIDKAIIDPQNPDQGNGYALSKSGVFYLGDDDPLFICSPLTVSAVTRDQYSQNYGRLLEWKDMDNNRHRWAMPMEMLAGDGLELRKVLLAAGLTRIGGGKARNHLITYLSSTPTLACATCVDRIGWHEKSYVLPDTVINNRSGDSVIFQTEAGELNHFRAKGSTEDWQNEIGKYCAGNSRLVFAVSMAFAAPLLHLSGIDGGGFNFKGSSSEGKSTALQVAASVCGGSEYLCTWRATSNGLEGVAASHNDALLILDEMGQVAPKEAGEIAYMLANGQGKQRASRSGSARAKKQWRTLFLSSGEISLSDHLLLTGQTIKAGQEVRLADIQMNTGQHGGFETLHDFSDGASFADHLKEKTAQIYGSPYRDYLSALMGYLEKLPSTIKQIQQDFINEHCPKDASGQVRRVAQRFAVVVAGGDIATTLGITGWPQDEAVRAAAVCFKTWLDQRGGSGNSEDQKAIERVVGFIQLHGQSRFAEWKSNSDRVIQNRAGYVQHEGVNTYYYFFPQIFDSEVCKGLDSRQTRIRLKSRGFLKTDSGKPTLIS